MGQCLALDCMDVDAWEFMLRAFMEVGLHGCSEPDISDRCMEFCSG